MSIDGLRKALATAQKSGGKVDEKELDKMMLKVRDQGGLDPAERAELLKAADGFDDATKQRLLKHLATLEQKSAWVNLAAEGRVRKIEGRYATLSTDVKGLTAQVGLFDNLFALKGKAKADGNLSLSIEGKSISVDVKAGDTAAQVMRRVSAKLPDGVKGQVLAGSVRPYEMAPLNGKPPKASEDAAQIVLWKPEALGLKPGEKPLRVVVTGYGAFQGITDNPSANIAHQLAERGIKGAIVEYRRLDVTHTAVNAFMEEMKKNPPDVILSMGVSSHSQVEERPENRVGFGYDGENKLIEAGVVRQGGKDELKTDLPLDAINAALTPFGTERVVGSSQSDPSYQPDRSAYLCNFLGYNLADAFGSTTKVTAGFVHITAETPVDQMHALLEAVASRQREVKRGDGPVS